jgi:hypothetical protein
VILFICNLFNDAASNLDYTAQTSTMVFVIYFKKYNKAAAFFEKAV